MQVLLTCKVFNFCEAFWKRPKVSFSIMQRRVKQTASPLVKIMQENLYRIPEATIKMLTKPIIAATRFEIDHQIETQKLGLEVFEAELRDKKSYYKTLQIQMELTDDSSWLQDQIPTVERKIQALKELISDCHAKLHELKEKRKHLQ